MITFRQPLALIDTKNQDIEDVAKKCGFGYLSKMIDFCNDPNNEGKIYRDNVNKFTYNKTLGEMDVFKAIGSKYENAIWNDFKRYSYYAAYKFWKFSLKKVDATNLTPDEYAKMEEQLKCIPPEILINCRYETYDSRTDDPKCIAIMKDPTYIKEYSKWKGINLSEEEAQEVYQLASELLKYGKPLKLVKRDEQADLGAVADNFGFTKVWAFDSWHKRRKKNNVWRNVRFYESVPEKIPYFIAQTQDFYALGMVVNPEGTKELYHNIEVDTGIVIKHQEITPNVSKGHHGDTPQNKGKKAQSGGGVRKATVP